jgi:hypothetical protein
MVLKKASGAVNAQSAVNKQVGGAIFEVKRASRNYL